MFPFMEPKSVLMPCYCLALAHPGMKSTSAVCTCRYWDFNFKVQTILILKRLFPQWEYGLYELFDFSVSSLDCI